MIPQETPIILIVDDVPTNVKILADSLRRNYRVRVALNGVDALERARTPPHPDLILLDVMMPGMDGYEVLRCLKQNPLTQKIPVIFVTAKSEETDEKIGLDLGAVDYIVKPFSISILMARVRNHVAMKQHADMLEALSMIDPLTNVSNRRGLESKLETEWKRMLRDGKPLSLLMIDIDYFKNYNDHYGHGAGDECLYRVACALRASLARPGDTLSRYGGEEFVAILPETDNKAVRQIAERLRERVLDLRLPHPRSAAGSQVSVSIGCATADSNNCLASHGQLLKQADEQLYRAKELGRNQVSIK
ncbi:two-component system, chemotaxis family, response regulator WspR [Gammaproteobacteria bacterium]